MTLLAASFAEPLTGHDAELMRSDGSVAALDVGRWHACADGEDRWLLGRCRGATIDLGCGPGRLVAALTARGIPALGVDAADEAIDACRRGAGAVQADVFGVLPGRASGTTSCSPTATSASAATRCGCPAGLRCSSGQAARC